MRVLGTIETELRPKIASYLRSGAIIFAIMEHTRDLVDEQFEVPGGSGIASDGTFFWRQDTPNYVEAYGIALDPKAIEIMRERNWVAPQLTDVEVLEIDQVLYGLMNGRPEVGAD